MKETVDGEYQNFKANDGAFVRKHFFGKYPKLLEMVSRMTDEDIWRLNRGGHDPHKIYAAYAAAVKHKGQPTVILAKTIKGFGMGKQGEAKNTHQQSKKVDVETIRGIPRPLQHPDPGRPSSRNCRSTFRPADSPEMKYLHERRRALGGYLPQRRTKADAPPVPPPLAALESLLKGSEGREISTTMAFVRILTALLRDKALGKHVVPIVPDEARTFGMEGMFRQLGIYSAEGQKYEPVDRDQLMYYREDKSGQILEEGINEAGAFSSWIAAATSYSHQQPGDGAVLHLLLDVRPAARRRSRLGGRRPARARLPDRRHRGAHHPERRGPAARGRTLACAVVGDSELRVLRPDLRL